MGRPNPLQCITGLAIAIGSIAWRRIVRKQRQLDAENLMRCQVELMRSRVETANAANELRQVQERSQRELAAPKKELAATKKELTSTKKELAAMRAANKVQAERNLALERQARKLHREMFFLNAQWNRKYDKLMVEHLDLRESAHKLSELATSLCDVAIASTDDKLKELRKRHTALAQSNNPEKKCAPNKECALPGMVPQRNLQSCRQLHQRPMNHS